MNVLRFFDALHTGLRQPFRRCNPPPNVLCLLKRATAGRRSANEQRNFPGSAKRLCPPKAVVMQLE